MALTARTMQIATFASTFLADLHENNKCIPLQDFTVTNSKLLYDIHHCLLFLFFSFTRRRRQEP